MKELLTLYSALYGHEPQSVEPITGSGSSRAYYRLQGEPTVIGCVGRDLKENEAFIYLTRHFSAKGLPVPQLLAVSEDSSAYLQEDFGDLSLYDAIRHGRETGEFNEEEMKLLRQSMEALADVQHPGAKGLDFKRCYPAETMDARMVQWDLNYFKYCFLKPSGIEFDEAALQDDFDRLTANITAMGATRCFMYRDFQTRNVMVRTDGPIGLIDYQGGRRGPVEYDVASMLWQARARLTESVRNELIKCYLERAHKYAEYDDETFRKRLQLMVLFRTLQVLGAYGFRGIIEGKAKFVEPIPAAMQTVSQLFADGTLTPYPALSKALGQLVGLPQYQPQTADGLTVRVLSFSYKQGLPKDYTGNGGGFIFDCRTMHNPGRYDRYKQLTGRDRPVIDFLEDRGEVQHFLSNVYGLVDLAVDRYLQRGFTSLMVCFGCTGGRHRSVYCAEHTARHIKYLFPQARVVLEHREQHITETL